MPEAQTERKMTAKQKKALTKEALAVRRHKALELHLAGASYEAIGRTLGVGRSAAHRDVKAALAELHAERLNDLDKERTKSLARIEGMMVSLAKAVRKGDAKAIAETRKLEALRMRLLGLEAPRQVQVQADVQVTGRVDMAVLTDAQLMAMMQRAQADVVDVSVLEVESDEAR